MAVTKILSQLPPAQSAPGPKTSHPSLDLHHHRLTSGKDSMGLMSLVCGLQGFALATSGAAPPALALRIILQCKIWIGLDP